MATQYYAGVDLALVGAWTVSVTYPTGVTTTVIDEDDFTTTKVCHLDLSADISSHTNIAAELQTRLQLIHAGFTCTFSESTMAYTIAHSTTNFDISYSTAAQNTLGFTANSNNVMSVTSTVRPYYVIQTQHDGRSNYTDRYEPDQIASLAISDAGTDFIGMARTGTPKYVDWRQQFETHAATMTHKATAAVPWTWQHLFEHARTVHPILVKDGYDNSIYRLRPEGSVFAPERQTQDFDDQWHIGFQAALMAVFTG